eukprot:GHVU01114100.1.p1 GENE.GHVU01114100.1~~GHVU01114100.1.p1  ORF type:complete len:407 (+),score=89.95 GHVU01114100.1:3-1223(+)
MHVCVCVCMCVCVYACVCVCRLLDIHRFIRDVYSKKFPKLESIIVAPLDYIAVVRRIQNNTDITGVDFSDVLPNTVSMAVTVASSMTTGSPLPPTELAYVVGACDEALSLAESRKDILSYLESRMCVLAPNVTAVLGSALAARLITHAGGVEALAKMPAQNIALVGAGRKATLGQSTHSAGVKQGIIVGSAIVQMTAPAFRSRALKRLAGKVALAARVDLSGGGLDAGIGVELKEAVLKGLRKIQEPPPPPQKKALPVPDDKPRARRGGKRHRRLKEKYGLSEFKKYANRLKFGLDAEGEYGTSRNSAFGMIGKSGGIGKLRLQVKQPKQLLNANALKRRQLVNARGGSTTAGGTASSLAFTPIQGIELCNPEARGGSAASGTQSTYFDSAGAFLKIPRSRVPESA